MVRTMGWNRLTCCGPAPGDQSSRHARLGPVMWCLPRMVLCSATESAAADVDSSNVSRLRLRWCARWRRRLHLPANRVFAGDGVAYSGAQAELERVAGLLAQRCREADAGESSFRYDHPLYQGMTGHMFGAASLPIMRRGDVQPDLRHLCSPRSFSRAGRYLRTQCKVIHIDLNAYEIREEPSGGFVS